MKKLAALLLVLCLFSAVFAQDPSQVISRLGIRGGTDTGGNTNYYHYIARLNAQGLFDPSLIDTNYFVTTNSVLFARKDQNLADLANLTTARNNLGLGSIIGSNGLLFVSGDVVATGSGTFSNGLNVVGNIYGDGTSIISNFHSAFFASNSVWIGTCKLGADPSGNLLVNGLIINGTNITVNANADTNASYQVWNPVGTNVFGVIFGDRASLSNLTVFGNGTFGSLTLNGSNLTAWTQISGIDTNASYIAWNPAGTNVFGVVFGDQATFSNLTVYGSGTFGSLTLGGSNLTSWSQINSLDTNATYIGWNPLGTNSFGTVYGIYIGDGLGISNLNANALVTGTIPIARYPDAMLLDGSRQMTGTLVVNSTNSLLQVWKSNDVTVASMDMGGNLTLNGIIANWITNNTLVTTNNLTVTGLLTASGGLKMSGKTILFDQTGLGDTDYLVFTNNDGYFQGKLYGSKNGGLTLYGDRGTGAGTYGYIQIGAGGNITLQMSSVANITMGNNGILMSDPAGIKMYDTLWATNWLNMCGTGVTNMLSGVRAQDAVAMSQLWSASGGLSNYVVSVTGGATNALVSGSQAFQSLNLGGSNLTSWSQLMSGIPDPVGLNSNNTYAAGTTQTMAFAKASNLGLGSTNAEPAHTLIARATSSGTDWGVYTTPWKFETTTYNFMEMKGGDNVYPGLLLWRTTDLTGWYIGGNNGGSLRIGAMTNCPSQGAITATKDASTGLTINYDGTASFSSSLSAGDYSGRTFHSRAHNSSSPSFGWGYFVPGVVVSNYDGTAMIDLHSADSPAQAIVMYNGTGGLGAYFGEDQSDNITIGLMSGAPSQSAYQNARDGTGGIHIMRSDGSVLINTKTAPPISAMLGVNGGAYISGNLGGGAGYITNFSTIYLGGNQYAVSAGVSNRVHFTDAGGTITGDLWMDEYGNLQLNSSGGEIRLTAPTGRVRMLARAEGTNSIWSGAMVVSNAFTATQLATFKNHVLIGVGGTTNQPLTIYGNDTNHTDPYLLNNNGICLDGPVNGDRFLNWCQTNENRWAIGTYRDEDMEFIYLYDGQGKRQPLVASQAGRFGINKLPDVMNYHGWHQGSGLDDFDVSGIFTMRRTQYFRVAIDGTGSPDTFLWATSFDNINFTTNATGVACPNTPTLLTNGVYISFGSTTGHTSGDKWSFKGNPQMPIGTLTVNPSYYSEIGTTTNYANNASWQDVTYPMQDIDASGTLPILPLGTNGAIYFGDSIKRNSIYFSFTTPAVGATLVVEYWNGNAWTTVTPAMGLVDLTSNLAQDGTITWNKNLMPDWSKENLTIDSYANEFYWIRLRSSTPITVAPVLHHLSPNGQYRFTAFASAFGNVPAFYVGADGSTHITQKGFSDTTPSTGKEIVNLETLRSAILAAQQSILYARTNDNPVVGGYKVAATTPGGASSVYLSATGVGTNAVLIKTYMTTNAANVLSYPAGTYHVVCYGGVNNTAGGTVSKIAGRLFSRTSGGTETYWSDVGFSPQLTTVTNALCEFDINVPTNATVNATDYVGISFYATNSAAGTNVRTITLATEGATATRVDLPLSINASTGGYVAGIGGTASNLTATGTLTIPTGAGTSKLLTSDNNGVATWSSTINLQTSGVSIAAAAVRGGASARSLALYCTNNQEWARMLGEDGMTHYFIGQNALAQPVAYWYDQTGTGPMIKETASNAGGGISMWNAGGAAEMVRLSGGGASWFYQPMTFSNLLVQGTATFSNSVVITGSSTTLETLTANNGIISTNPFVGVVSGPAFMGSIANNTVARFANTAMTNDYRNYMIQQDNTGATIVNATSGKTINFAIYGSNKGSLNSDGTWTFGGNTTVNGDLIMGGTGEITNVTALTIGGVRRTSWPAAGGGDAYLASNNIFNAVNTFNSNTVYGVSAITAIPLQNVDFRQAPYQVLSLTNDVALVPVNATTGLTVTLKIIADGSTRNVITTNGWTRLSGSATNAVSANKCGILTVTYFDANPTNAVMTFAPQP